MLWFTAKFLFDYKEIGKGHPSRSNKAIVNFF